ncbi:pumilio homolog 5-like isoform X2 [Prosopis cineraria]|uniref:pumilio homolog 5-like isoform X2 n=1 Tax=Prosopis cineraria TaxID=364024 RepID=UPI00240FC7B6|nr:pumilio homolog 5-like isoform X2 [Prosopis cineraria]
MATESLMRMVEGSQTSQWLSSKDIPAFGSFWRNKSTEELDIFLKGQKLSQCQADFTPNRSGSAPPSMEGSVAAVGNMLPVKDSSLVSNSRRLSNALGDHKSEGELFDPSNVACCLLELNLDPKLPNQFSNHEKNQGIADSDDGGMVDPYTIEAANIKGSSKLASESLFNPNSMPNPGNNAVLSASLHKSLVDLIQEDFPRTPSPVYNQSHLSSHATTQDSVDVDVQAISSSVSSIDLSNQPDSATCSTGAVVTGILNTDACELTSNQVSLLNFQSLQHADETQNLSVEPSPTNNKDALLKDYVSRDGAVNLEEHKLRASDVRRERQEQQQSYGRNKLNQSFTSDYAYKLQVTGSQFSQGINNSHSYLGMLAYSNLQFSPLGIQSSSPSTGLTGPYYATPTAFMTSGNPFYHDIQPSGFLPPQYRLGGYALGSTSVAPYMVGYSSQGDPLPFEAAGSQDLNGQATNAPLGDGVPHASGFQSHSKICGQYGLPMQPSYANPINMRYFPHTSSDVYPAFHQSQLSSRSLTGGLACSLPSHQDAAVPAYLNGHKFQSSAHGSLTIPSNKNMGISGSSYYGNSNKGVVMQCPPLSCGVSISPSSSIGKINPLGGKIDKKMPHVSVRNAGFSPGQRAIKGFGVTKQQSFLEELKSINHKEFKLSHLAGRVVELSRFIQRKLENCSAEEKASVFEEILPYSSKLVTDVFGNYVIQKFFEHGSPDQRKNLADQLSGQILPLSLQMYGCRVIQKALEVIELDQKTLLVQELDGHVMRCVHDQNGNHVIQKCIECIPVGKIHFIISAFQGQVPALSVHPYGCRVIQRILEHCSDEQCIQFIVDEIMESACVLSQDQYGNYVTQHVLKRGKNERGQIIRKLAGSIVQLSHHKYASNVIEKCLEHGDATEREAMIAEIIGQPGEDHNLLTMMKDQFGNYVIQKLLDIGNDRHREILLNHIRNHIDALKKYTYGKHIVALYEQLVRPASEA